MCMCAQILILCRTTTTYPWILYRIAGFNRTHKNSNVKRRGYRERERERERKRERERERDR